MSSEFDELDGLKEDDIMAALDGLGDIEPISMPSVQKSETSVPAASSSQSGGIELSSAQTGDLVSIISQLLNNKTLEITIRVKN